jgi:hypothetical protein
MTSLPELFENNKTWVRETEAQDPGLFSRLSRQQSPKYPREIRMSKPRVEGSDRDTLFRTGFALRNSSFLRAWVFGWFVIARISNS